MKIKKLKWKEGDVVSWESSTPFGEYLIEETGQFSGFNKPFIWSFNDLWREAKSVDLCKEAAQRHFEKCVKGCLEGAR